MPSRRDFLLSGAGLLLVGLASRRVPAQVSQPITVYKSKSCGCCTLWVEHLKANGYSPVVHDEEAMDPLKEEMGVPVDLRSCHTAVAGGYLIEGHVPAADIKRLLTERPKIAGLAVPGMPSGTPGMARSDAEAGGYTVLAFQSDGTSRTFASH